MKRLVPSFLAPIALVLAASCSGESPVEPTAPPGEALLETAAAKKGGEPKLDEDALSIDDMLSDPLFQALVQGIEEPSLSEPLLAAVDALTSGQLKKAKNLIAKASAEADGLEEDETSEARIFWSAIERYLDEAELI